jgi:hypothetical protein
MGFGVISASARGYATPTFRQWEAVPSCAQVEPIIRPSTAAGITDPAGDGAKADEDGAAPQTTSLDSSAG